MLNFGFWIGERRPESGDRKVKSREVGNFGLPGKRRAGGFELSGGEFRANPHRVFAKVQDRENLDLRLSLVVVDAERKPAR